MHSTRLPVLLPLTLACAVVLAVLLIVQPPGITLSASVPQVITMPKWTCDITCKCSAQSQQSEIFYDVIGTAPGQENICSLTDPGITSGADNSANFGSRSSSDCNTICQATFPNRVDVRGNPIMSSRTNCRRIGSCNLLIPQNTSPPPAPASSINPFTSPHPTPD